MDPTPLATSRPAPPKGRRRQSMKPAGGDASPDAQNGDDTSKLSTPIEGNSFEGDAPLDAHVDVSTSTTLSSAVPSSSSNRSFSSNVDEPDEISPEEMQHALAGLTTDDLFLALRRAKVELDRQDQVVLTQINQLEALQASYSDVISTLERYEGEIDRLHGLVQQREARVDELTAEQDKMEAEIYAKLGIVERLRSRADESDRKLGEAQRRIDDATQAAEKEREYYYDQEVLLRSQAERLTKDNAALKEEVGHLRETIESLAEQLPPEDEGDKSTDEKAVPIPSLATGLSPPERSRILASQSLDTPSRSRFAKPLWATSPTRRTPSALGQSFSSVDDEPDAVQAELDQLKKTLHSQEAAMSQLRSALVTEKSRVMDLETEKEDLESLLTGTTLHQLMANRDRVTSSSRESESEATSDSVTDSAATSDTGLEDEDDVPDVPTTPKSRKGPGPRSSSYQRRRPSLGEVPESLGDELELGHSSDTERESKPSRKEEDLTAELARLRQENRNLSMYVSKILSRIIAVPGFEEVLASDSLGVDTMRKSTIKNKRNSVMPQSSSPMSSSSVQQKKDRRRSAGIFGFRARDEDASMSTSFGSPGQAAAGYGRSLANILPWSSNNPADRSTGSATSASTSTTTTQKIDGSVLPRRMEVGDAIDEAERQRARALLEKSGHDVPDHQLAPISPTVRSGSKGSEAGAGGIHAFLNRLLSGGETSQDEGAQAPGSSTKESQDEPTASSTTTESKSVSAASEDLSIISSPLPDVSRGSVAGDESYAFRTMSADNSDIAADDSNVTDTSLKPVEEPTWKRALKRMSLLAGEPPSTASLSSTEVSAKMRASTPPVLGGGST